MVTLKIQKLHMEQFATGSQLGSSIRLKTSHEVLALLPPAAPSSGEKTSGPGDTMDIS